MDHATTGDEPHYLVMDYSLLKDHDLNLKNQYAAKDYLKYYNAPLAPHVGQRRLKNNAYVSYSFHGIGLPVLAFPAYLLADKAGVVAFMTIMATVVVVLSWMWVRQVSGSKNIATLTSTLFTLCYFFNGLAGYIYPDMIIAVLMLSSVILINSRRWLTPWREVLLATSLSLMVFVHFKTLAFVAPAIFVLVVRCWTKYRRLPLLVLGILGFFLCTFFITLHQWFGVWIPSQIYSSSVHLNTSIAATVPAMLFDSLRGLFVYNPILLLIATGIPLWAKLRKFSLYSTLGILAPSILLLSVFNEWQGGDAPTGRYVIIFIPLLLPALGFCLSQLSRVWQKTLIMFLVCITGGITVISTLQKLPYVGLKTHAPIFVYIESKIHVPFDKPLPTYSLQTTLIGSHDKIKIMLCVVFLICMFLYGHSITRYKEHPTLL